MQRAFAYFAAFTGMGALFAGVLLLAAVIVGPGPASGSSASRSPGSSVAAGPIGTIEVHAFDLGFKPAEVAVAAAGEYDVKFVNDGGVLHDLTFADGTKVSAEGGKTATGSVTVPTGGLTFICSVPGHADAGMRGSVTVHEHGVGQASPSASASMTAEQMRDHDAAVTAQVPAKTSGHGNEVLEPTILADGT
jgi:uncharacterized cupredoxin-like copper-binding protein